MMKAIASVGLGLFLGACGLSSGHASKSNGSNTNVARSLDPGAPCPTAETSCSGVCVNLLFSSENCGACGTVCPNGATCSNGACAFDTDDCPTGGVQCGTSCVDVTQDPNNCGGCGQICGTGFSCGSGACVCTGAVCGSSCVQPQTDPNNCGGCGHTCPSGQSCVGGQCSQSCGIGQTACPGACVDLTKDPHNCGVCGEVCGAGTDCFASQCTTPAYPSHTGYWLFQVEMHATAGLDGVLYAITQQGAWAFTPNTWAPIGSGFTNWSQFTVATGSDGRIYALGGNCAGCSPVSAAYSPSNQGWASVSPMHMPRTQFGLARAGDGRLYAMGGIDATNATVAAMEAYSPGADSWTSVAPLLTPRSGFAVGTGNDGRIYVFGGHDATGTSLANGEVYDPGTGAWSAIAPTQTIWASAATVVVPQSDGTLWLIDPNSVSTVQIYNPATRTWGDGPALFSTYWQTAGAANAADGRLYVVDMRWDPNGGPGAWISNFGVHAYDNGLSQWF